MPGGMCAARSAASASLLAASHLQLALAEVGGHPSVVSLQQGARASRLLRRALLADEFLATLRGGAANRLALVRGDEIDVVVVEE